MTITRTVNGVEVSFELTQRELKTAYLEKRMMIAKDDLDIVIDDFFEFMEQYHEVKISAEDFRASDEMMKRAAGLYLNVIEYAEEYWSDTARNAIYDTLKERELVR